MFLSQECMEQLVSTMARLQTTYLHQTEWLNSFSNPPLSTESGFSITTPISYTPLLTPALLSPSQFQMTKSPTSPSLASLNNGLKPMSNPSFLPPTLSEF